MANSLILLNKAEECGKLQEISDVKDVKSLENFFKAIACFHNYLNLYLVLENSLFLEFAYDIAIKIYNLLIKTKNIADLIDKQDIDDTKKLNWYKDISGFLTFASGDIIGTKFLANEISKDYLTKILKVSIHIEDTLYKKFQKYKAERDVWISKTNLAIIILNKAIFDYPDIDSKLLEQIKNNIPFLKENISKWISLNSIKDLISDYFSLVVAYLLVKEIKLAMSYGYCLKQIFIELSNENYSEALNWALKTDINVEFYDFEDIFLSPTAKYLLRFKDRLLNPNLD